jgi:hypothetical protein
VPLRDEVDELLRLASQRDQLERFRKETFTNPLDPEDEDCSLLRAIEYTLGKRFWRMAYEIGARIGWEPGCALPAKPFGDEENSPQ